MPSKPPEDLVQLDPAHLERTGRRWLIVSFLACPCHLPFSLAILGAMLGGTALGAVLRSHTLLAGLIIATTWAAGTARGLVLVRRAEKGGLTCDPPRRKWNRPRSATPVPSNRR